MKGTVLDANVLLVEVLGGKVLLANVLNAIMIINVEYGRFSLWVSNQDHEETQTITNMNIAPMCKIRTILF